MQVCFAEVCRDVGVFAACTCKIKLSLRHALSCALSRSLAPSLSHSTVLQYSDCSINSNAIRRFKHDSFFVKTSTHLIIFSPLYLYWTINLTTSCTMRPHVAGKMKGNVEEDGEKERDDCLSSPTVHCVPRSSCCHAASCIHSSVYTQPNKERDQKVTCVNGYIWEHRMRMSCTVIWGSLNITETAKNGIIRYY